MGIKNWPPEDRPIEKLLMKGEQMLTDAELMAICLKSGLPGKTSLDIAKELLHEYGNLKKLMQSSKQTLIKKPGIGLVKYAVLKAAIELGRRYVYENVTVKTVFDNSQITQRFLSQRLREYRSEIFACLFLDNHHGFICYEELFQGTINETNIYPREIVRRGLHHNAAKVILAHNHPSGWPQPSQADKMITNQIRQTLNLVDIKVVDHIIIGNPENFSFAEAGMMDLD